MWFLEYAIVLKEFSEHRSFGIITPSLVTPNVSPTVIKPSTSTTVSQAIGYSYAKGIHDLGYICLQPMITKLCRKIHVNWVGENPPTPANRLPTPGVSPKICNFQYHFLRRNSCQKLILHISNSPTAMWTFTNFPDKHIGPHFKEGEDRKEEGRIGERGTEAGDRPPTSLGLKVALYMSTKCVNLLEQSKHRQQTRGRLKRTPQQQCRCTVFI